MATAKVSTHTNKIRSVPGRECREKLFMSSKLPKRIVPAFTYQALQKNTKVQPPETVNVFKTCLPKQTLFNLFLKRGDIPVTRTGTLRKGKGYPVKWACDPMELDYCYYLPVFVDGLADSNIEIRQLAEYGALDLIVKAPHKILPVLPKLILPFKRAFATRHKGIIVAALKVIQQMVLLGPCVGQALVPYYRQLLFVCNLYKNTNVNLLEGVDNDRSKRVADVIEDTLSMLERCGGPNAFINIKYMIPTYESCMYPKCDPNN